MAKRRKNKPSLLAVIILVVIALIGVKEADVIDIDNTKLTNSLLDGDVYVHFIDVGQGSSVLIQQGKNGILVDSGLSDYGDTVSDFIFFAVTLIKLLPVIHIPKWIWVWIVIIAIIKIFNVILGFIYKKKLISLHTVMNKITGLLLFILPLTLEFIEIKYCLIAVCIIATISAIQEGYLIIKER